MKQRQRGFTLIEIAIVLVIIGLLLGGVLKGQELINSAKVKNLAGDFKNIPVYIYGYQDKYKALPGDDPNVAAHVGGTGTTPTACTGSGAGTCDVGNGIIDGNWDADTDAAESYVFWQHIRLAGFGPGSVDTSAAKKAEYLQRNAVGGQIGITNTSSANIPIKNMKGTYVVCSNGIPGKFAKQLDTTLDNGDTTTGSVMVASASATAPRDAIPTTGTGAIVDDDPYLVCMGY
jgi:prepilin-type N-terminal cleavage/methylation domain-containing protein